MNRHPLASATALMTTAALLFGLMAILAKGAAAPAARPRDRVRPLLGRAGCLRRRRLPPPPARPQLARPASGAARSAARRCSATSSPSSTSPSARPRCSTTRRRSSRRSGPGCFSARRSRSAPSARWRITTGGVAIVMVANAPPGGVALGTWQLVGILSAVLSGAAVATIRELRKTDGSWEIFAAFCVAGTLFTGVPAARHWVAPTASEWALLFGVGITSVAAQLMMTHALRDLPAAAAGVLFQLTPVSTMVLGRILFRRAARRAGHHRRCGHPRRGGLGRLPGSGTAAHAAGAGRGALSQRSKCRPSFSSRSQSGYSLCSRRCSMRSMFSRWRHKMSTNIAAERIT